MSNELIFANGFLPNRGSLMLDTVFVAMFAIMVALAVSVKLARSGRYRWHRRLQIGIASVLVVALIAFEIDVRFFTNWRELAVSSPWYASGAVDVALWIHLAFAVPTPVVWGVVIFRAVRQFKLTEASFPSDNLQRNRAWHRRWGRVAALMMMATAVTGCVFYWLAFVSS